MSAFTEYRHRFRYGAFRNALLVLPLLCAGATVAANASEPRLFNANLHTQAAEGQLDKTFRMLLKAQEEPAWIGYATPIVEGNYHVCCWSSEDEHLPASLHHGRCLLEEREEG